MTLAEVAIQLRERGSAIRAQDAELDQLLDTIEQQLFDRGVRKLLKAPIVEGITLGWSQRGGRWRLVIVDDHSAIPLFEATPEERIEAITSGALGKIVKQAIELQGGRS
jgi:hypothetical protein